MCELYCCNTADNSLDIDVWETFILKEACLLSFNYGNCQVLLLSHWLTFSWL